MIVAALVASLSTVVAVAAPCGDDSSWCSDDRSSLLQINADSRDVAVRFAAFIQQHGRTYHTSSEEYSTRFQHFKEQLAAVDAQNRNPGRSWTAAVNHLADRTPAELAVLRGYRRSPEGLASTGHLGLAATSARSIDVKKLPENFTWKGHLASMQDVLDQKSCGSCWAISSSTALRAHAELYQKDRTFSTQQMVECTPNPNECGGQGGCKGATVELAMEYAFRAGLATEEEHPYQGSDNICAKHMQTSEASFRSIGKESVSLPQVSIHNAGGASFGMRGWKKLAENKLTPLLEAVYEKGPVVVSVAATDAWNMYSSGILSACKKGAVNNHAVVLVGYGKAEHHFWQIQNSWGSNWGEEGFVRLFRHAGQEEEQYCGWDEKPQDGTACKGGPSKVYVCGSCSILSDNVVPLFDKSGEGFLSKHSRDASGVFAQLNTSTQHLQH